MELKDRIQQIMNNERLTASVFADSIGVQRSSISHIISGRNKPSLEFIQKVLLSFPKYSSNWLIFGEGDMLNIPRVIETDTPKQQNIIDKDLFNATKDEQHSTKDEIDNNEDDKAVIASIKTKGNSQNTPNLGSSTSKEIEKIVIFYTDNTFRAYIP